MKKHNNKLRIFAAIFIILIVLVGVFPAAKVTARSSLYSFTGRISGGLFSFGTNIRQKFSFIGNIGRLRSENERLADMLNEFQVDSSRIAELENENKLLKQELGFFQLDQQEVLVPAKIIQREPVSFLDNFLIDKGSSEGIVKNMAVISHSILVGQIDEVYEHSSRVVLITSKDSVIQAMLQDSRAKGILRGGLSGLFLENIVSDAEYKDGENIITSGLGGELKQGILIGKADKAGSSGTGLFKTVAVEPLVDLTKLEIVFVQK
ncbi:MAG: rod shape-determining protein MreC [Candidatus Berkelbacteria bacterium]